MLNSDQSGCFQVQGVGIKNIKIEGGKSFEIKKLDSLLCTKGALIFSFKNIMPGI